MGEIERTIDGTTIFHLDQTEAFSQEILKKLISIQKAIDSEFGDNTSGVFLAEVVASQAEELCGDDPARLLSSFVYILCGAVKVLVELGWPGDESLPVKG